MESTPRLKNGVGIKAGRCRIAAVDTMMKDIQIADRFAVAAAGTAAVAATGRP